MKNIRCLDIIVVHVHQIGLFEPIFNIVYSAVQCW